LTYRIPNLKRSVYIRIRDVDMLRCVILDDYQNAALSHGDFASLSGVVDIQVLRETIPDTTQLLAEIAPYDIVVAMRERTRFDAERLAGLPNLKLLITTGMRNASIDLEAAKRHGIVVCGTGTFAGSTAELTWGLLLALVRQIPREFAHFQSGNSPWQLSVGRDLRGLNLGVIGLGTLGSQVAKYGTAFGMNVMGWSRNNTPERSSAMGIAYAPSLDVLLAESDVVSIHIPLNASTRGLIGIDQLSLMKRDAILLNTSRGPIVGEAALILALQEGRLGGAGVDVFDTEPLPVNHPLRSVPNLIATPHLGYVTKSNYNAYFSGVVEDIAAYLAGHPIRLLT
jgi:phosphoglycerate dehydrogenase-like enzyme